PRRLGHRGERLRATGHRPARGAGDPATGLPARSGDRARSGDELRAGEHCRRPPLRLGGPADPLPMSVLLDARVRRPHVLVAIAVLVSFALVALLADRSAAHDPLRVYPGAALEPPSARFLLGIDGIGRSLAVPTLFGARAPPL